MTTPAQRIAAAYRQAGSRNFKEYREHGGKKTQEEWEAMQRGQAKKFQLKQRLRMRQQRQKQRKREKLQDAREQAEKEYRKSKRDKAKEKEKAEKRYKRGNVVPAEPAAMKYIEYAMGKDMPRWAVENIEGDFFNPRTGSGHITILQSRFIVDRQKSGWLHERGETYAEGFQVVGHWQFKFSATWHGDGEYKGHPFTMKGEGSYPYEGGLGDTYKAFAMHHEPVWD